MDQYLILIGFQTTPFCERLVVSNTTEKLHCLKYIYIYIPVITVESRLPLFMIFSFNFIQCEKKGLQFN